MVTGEINDNLIVDAAQKSKIQRWIAQIEKIPLQNIITIGDGNVGPVAQRLFDAIQDIQYGRIEDPLGWVETVC